MNTNVQGAIDAVADFHSHMNIDFKAYFPDPCTMVLCGNERATWRHDAVQTLNRLRAVSKIALQSYNATKSLEELRFHLEAEECSERMIALLQGDIVEYCDGWADSLYVMCGSAVSFGLPMEEVFKEVHRSNMTKRPRRVGRGCPRLSDKGNSYSPPDIAGVLRAHSHYTHRLQLPNA